MTESPKVDNFIQERLDALNSIDRRIVELLEGVSKVFETYAQPKRGDVTSLKEQVESHARTVYDCISDIAIDLRKEVKTMDDNIGVYNKNKDNIMLLPISVGQKNTSIGLTKLNEQLEVMDKLVGPVEVPSEPVSESEPEPESESDSKEDDPIKMAAKERNSVVKEEPDSAVDIKSEITGEEQESPKETTTAIEKASENEDRVDSEVKKESLSEESVGSAESKEVKEEESKSNEDEDAMDVDNNALAIDSKQEAKETEPEPEPETANTQTMTNEVIDLDDDTALMDLEKNPPSFSNVIDLDDLSPSGDFLMKE